MKPESIRKFDKFYLGSLAVSILSIVVGFDALTQRVGAEGAAQGVNLGPGVAIGAFAFGIAINLLLWWLASSKRFSLAKWIIVLFLVISLFSLPTTISGGLTLLKAMGLLSTVLQAVAVYYLFQPDAKEWFSGKAIDTPASTD